MKVASVVSVAGLLSVLPSVVDAFVRPGLIFPTIFAVNSNNGSSSSSTSTELGVFNFLNEGKKKMVKSIAGDYDKEAVRARMDGLIKSNPVLMFSFTTWPFCVKAKEVLDSLGASYRVVELDGDPDGKAIRAEMADLVGRTSVPAIWIQQEFIGGCNDGPSGGIVKLNESGDLKDLLIQAGAM
jgi:glutaredoxin 3